MKVSALGRAAIMQREGCRLSAYLDTRGIWTIGVGHTGMETPPKPYDGMKISRDQADAFLAGDIAPIEATINRVLKRAPTQNQFDAMASLAFNIGKNGFAGSSVVRAFNLGEITAAANSFLFWDKPEELIGRRREERAQFLTPDGKYKLPA